MRAAALPCLAVLVLAVGTARAQDGAAPPEQGGAAAPEIFYPAPRVSLSVELEYTASPRARKCPGEEMIRALVASRLGYDPFSPRPRAVPSGRLHLTLDREPGQFVITSEYVRADGKVDAKDTFREPDRGPLSCESAFTTAAVSLAVYFSIRERALAKELLAKAAKEPAAPAAPPPEPPAPAPAPAPPAIPAAPVPAPAAPKRNVAIHGGVDGVFNPLVTPSVSLGFAPWAGVRFREPAISIELGMRAMWSVKATVASNYVPYRWTYASGVLAATVHKSFFFGGPIFEAGTLTASTDHPLREVQLPAFLAIGFRAGIERALADIVILRASVEAAYVPHRAVLRDNVAVDRLLWTMPSFSAAIAAGIAFNIW